jgi:hypothetical protein
VPKLKKIVEARTIEEILPTFKELIYDYCGEEVEPSGMLQFYVKNREYLENQKIDLV